MKLHVVAQLVAELLVPLLGDSLGLTISGIATGEQIWDHCVLVLVYFCVSDLETN